MTRTTEHTPGPITDNLAHDIGEFLLDRHDQFTHWCEDQYAYIETDIQTIVPKLKAAPAMYEALRSIPDHALDCRHSYPHTLACWNCIVKAALAQAEGQQL